MADLDDPLVQRFRRARRDDRLTVLDGFYALTHALRFGAEVLEVLTSDRDAMRREATLRAPDLLDWIDPPSNPTAGVDPPSNPTAGVDYPSNPTAGVDPPIAEVDPEILSLLSTQGPRGLTMAIARRPPPDATLALSDPRPAPLLFLEEPRNLGNIGASVRVAAAAEAAGVLTTGHNDPWHPDAVRGAAGLQYALPVVRVPHLPDCDRPLVALEPGGDPIRSDLIPPRAILAFGGERHGLSQGLLSRADLTIGIPIHPAVMSLNLATAVSVTLFTWRLRYT